MRWSPGELRGLSRLAAIAASAASARLPPIIPPVLPPYATRAPPPWQPLGRGYAAAAGAARADEPLGGGDEEEEVEAWGEAASASGASAFAADAAPSTRLPPLPAVGGGTRDPASLLWYQQPLPCSTAFVPASVTVPAALAGHAAPADGAGGEEHASPAAQLSSECEGASQPPDDGGGDLPPLPWAPVADAASIGRLPLDVNLRVRTRGASLTGVPGGIGSTAFVDVHSRDGVAVVVGEGRYFAPAPTAARPLVAAPRFGASGVVDISFAEIEAALGTPPVHPGAAGGPPAASQQVPSREWRAGSNLPPDACPGEETYEQSSDAFDTDDEEEEGGVEAAAGAPDGAAAPRAGDGAMAAPAASLLDDVEAVSVLPVAGSDDNGSSVTWPGDVYGGSPGGAAEESGGAMAITADDGGPVAVQSWRLGSTAAAGGEVAHSAPPPALGAAAGAEAGAVEAADDDVDASASSFAVAASVMPLQWGDGALAFAPPPMLDPHTWGLPPAVVAAQRQRLLEFYASVAPERATPAQASSAWALYGPRVWDALERKYGVASVAAFRGL